MGSRSSRSDSGAPQRARGQAPRAATPAEQGTRGDGGPERDPDLDASEVVYGRNAVREALRGKRTVRALLVADEGEGAGVLTRAVGDWCREAGVPTPRIVAFDHKGLTARLRTPDHQGVAAEVDSYAYVDPQRLLDGHTLILALDEVQDPHNLGAVIRTAEASGAGVVITRHRAAGVTGAVVKASAGATEHAAVAQVRNLSDFLAEAKRSGFWIYGAEAGATSPYWSEDYSYPTCFVLGSEGQGLGKRVASLCDVLVSLPLLGAVGSLNVSVSAGVLAYEALRQRQVGAL